MFPFTPEKIWVDRSVEKEALTLQILERLQGIPTEYIDDIQIHKRRPAIDVGKRQMVITRHRGIAFKQCQGMTDDHICCHYYVIDMVSGCPMDCSYCILQHYLENNPITTVYVNINDILREVSEFIEQYPEKTFRIGTGELSDSLALDPMTEHAKILIPFFAQQPNALLELKTKTDFVDHLLDLNHNGRTVISWSVNAEHIIRDEEKHTASLEKRLAAAQKCVAAGYKVGFHLDPIVIIKGDEDELASYVDVADKIFESVNPDDIAWISLGLLRFPYPMKTTVQRRFPSTRIFSGEIIPAGNKMRYARFLREVYYRPLWDRLTKRLPPEKVYLCMETENVWKKLDSKISCHEALENRLTP
jgi:spore photoproduct lyase